MSPTRARFYTRPGCHLCDEAWPAIARLEEEGRLSLERVDISTDPALELRYGFRIPVLELEDGRLFEPPLSAWHVRQALDTPRNT